MRIAFFGSSDFALPSLEVLYADHRNEIVCVITQPDRKKGRGQRIGATPVKEKALERGLNLFQPADVNEPEAVEYLRALEADLFCIVAFGQILSHEVIEIPALYTIGIHGSLLPQYRGAAPIGWALINGETQTGVTLFRVVRGVDAGDSMLHRSCAITDDDTALTLSSRLAKLGAEVLAEGLNRITAGTIEFKQQDNKGSSSAPKFKAHDGHIDWSQPAAVIHNRIRGVQPWPGAYSTYGGTRLKLLLSRVDGAAPEGSEPGEILTADPHQGIRIATGDRIVQIDELQIAGGKPLDARAFLVGHRLVVGERLE